MLCSALLRFRESLAPPHWLAGSLMINGHFGVGIWHNHLVLIGPGQEVTHRSEWWRVVPRAHDQRSHSGSVWRLAKLRIRLHPHSLVLKQKPLVSSSPCLKSPRKPAFSYCLLHGLKQAIQPSKQGPRTRPSISSVLALYVEEHILDCRSLGSSVRLQLKPCRPQSWNLLSQFFFWAICSICQ